MRTVGVKLVANVSDYMSGIKRAGAATKDFGGELDKAAKGGQLDQVADRAAVAGLGLVGLAGTAFKLSMDFDKSMSGVAAATHVGADQINLLREAALQAGKDTSFSATEAADGITELSKAGVATADVLGGGLKGALDLAAAGQLDVGEAAETAASAMTQFKLKGSDVPHIADLLAAAAGKAQGSVHDMGMALNQAGLVAAQTGLTIEETTGTLAAFASAGLTGSDAGTSFKQMLLMLQSPSDSTRKLMDKMGITLYDNQGKFMGMAKFADQLRNSLKDLTPEARQATMAQIFGADAVRASSIVYENGAEGIQKWIDKTNSAGYAAETAKIQTDNLSGDIERLTGSLETLAIEAGGGATGGLRTLVQAADALIGQFSALPSGIGGTITVMSALGGVLLLGAAGWVKMRRSTADALEELRNTGPAGTKAAAGLQATTKWAGRAGAAFLAMEIGATAINAAIGSDLNPQIDALGKGLQSFASTGKASGETARILGTDMGKLDTAMKDVADTGRWSTFSRGFGGSIESLTGTGHAFDDSLTKSKERLQAVDQALQQLVSGGNAAAAAEVFSTLAERAKEQGVSTAELKKVLPGYAAALETAGGAAGSLADATGKLPGATEEATGFTKEYKTAADAAAGAADGYREALTALSDQMKAEADPVFALLAAQRDLTKAQKDAAKATKEHGANSAEAKEATSKLASAAIDLQGKVGALGATFDGKLSPAMLDTLRKANLTEGQIRNVEKQFADAKRVGDAYAKTYQAKAALSGVPKARADLRQLQSEINRMKGKTLPITVRITQKGETVYGNQAPQMAAGGPVTGAGPKGVDSVMRMLAPGEHVWTAPEVDAAGGHSAVSSIRASVLSGDAPRAMPASRSSTQVMSTSASSSTTVVYEHRVTFDGAQGELGQLFLKAIRTSPGVQATAAKLLGVKRA